MMNTLYLSASERLFLEKIPSDVRSGWEVADETGVYIDSPLKQKLRMSLMRLHDPHLLSFKEKAQKVATAEELKNMIADMDLSHVNESDLSALFFAIGPEVISRLIGHTLARATTDEQVEQVASLTLIRHSLYTAFASSRVS